MIYLKLIYKGEYKGEVEVFESARNVKNAVKYEEASTPEELLKAISIPATILQMVLIVIVVLLNLNEVFSYDFFFQFLIAFLVSLLLLVLHEFLHAICFRKKVYLYTNLKQLMLFVVGEDHLTKFGFIFMSLLPNIVLGFIPFVIFLFNIDLVFLGFLGAFCISSGMGDYYNVYNTLKQVPKGGKIFVKAFNSYWYLEEKK